MIGVSVDTPSAIVIGMVLAAVVLVFWASRPSVIARYAVKQEPSDTPSPAPPRPAAQPGREEPLRVATDDIHSLG